MIYKIGHVTIIQIILMSGLIGIIMIIPEATSQYIPHDPIFIEGDDDFAAQAASEGWPGDGTEGNPYVIEGYEINASDNNGFEILNTSVNFIIRESFIRGERAGSEGIYLYNVTNGTINNCVIENTRIGLELILSSANQITENTLTQNYWRGIHLTNSDGNLIDHNNITETEWRSIYLEYSDNNRINNNSISQDSSDNAINIYYSRRNIVKNNTMIACGLFVEGFEIDDWVSQDIDNW
jgi:parallel beta-helix repeat protein